MLGGTICDSFERDRLLSTGFRLNARAHATQLLQRLNGYANLGAGVGQRGGGEGKTGLYVGISCGGCSGGRGVGVRRDMQGYANLGVDVMQLGGGQ